MTAEPIIRRPGVYDIPQDEYHADPVPGGSLSSSGARRLLPPGCPALFKYEQDHPVYSDAFDFGTVAHGLVLGSGPEVVVVEAKDWRTKAARDTREEAREAGKVALLEGDFDEAAAMVKALRAHPIASALFHPETGEAERTLLWVDQPSGIWRRARLDWMPHPQPGRRYILADYKTTTCAEPGAIAKSVYSYGYHQQAAWYSDGLMAVGVAEQPEFLFVFQEKTPPYLITVAGLDAKALQTGRARNRRAIEIYARCREAGTWPGYSSEVEYVSLPPWAEEEVNR